MAITACDRLDIGTRPGLFDPGGQSLGFRHRSLFLKGLLQTQKGPGILGMPIEIGPVNCFGFGKFSFGQQ